MAAPAKTSGERYWRKTQELTDSCAYDWSDLLKSIEQKQLSLFVGNYLFEFEIKQSSVLLAAEPFAIRSLAAVLYFMNQYDKLVGVLSRMPEVVAARVSEQL